MAEFTTALQDTLEAFTVAGAQSPYFAKVFKGEVPSLMPTPRPLARWRIDRVQAAPEGPRVISNQMMRTVVFTVYCYWPHVALAGSEQLEDDIATVAVTLPPAINALVAASYTLGGVQVSAITVEDTSPITVDFPTERAEAQLRIFQFEVHVRLLEE